MQGLPAQHYFFKHLLFHAVDGPELLLSLRRVCRAWRALLSDNDDYWTRHRLRLCAQLPPLRDTFARSTAPTWRVFAMLLAMGAPRQRNCRRRFDVFWRGVLEAIVLGAHRHPQRVQRVECARSCRMRDTEFQAITVHYVCGARVRVMGARDSGRQARIIGGNKAPYLMSYVMGNCGCAQHAQANSGCGRVMHMHAL